MEVPTIEIVSPRDPEKMWRINAADFDASRHTRWQDRKIAPAPPSKPAATRPEAKGR